MFGWDAGREAGATLEAPLFEDALRFLSKRPERRLRILRGKGLPVVEDCLDILVPRKNPGAYFRRIEDRRVFSRVAVEGEWIGQIERIKSFADGFCGILARWAEGLR